jgi:hypothetical protein
MTSSQNVIADTAEGRIDAKYQWNQEKPTVLVFDVNETLIDFESMNPLFEKLFGDRRVLREWFGHLIMYSMTITLSGLYKDFFSLNWLRVLGTTERSQINQRICHQFHAIVPLLDAFKTQQQPLEFILPCKGPLHLRA